jgi:DMSO/TMAO reductase YedYZ molybdopterin-dependent catalytic subunit
MDVSRSEAATALSAGIAAVAGSFGVAGRTPAFVGAPVAAVVVDLTPSVVVAAAIQRLGDWGHRLAFGVALLLAVGLFAGVALVAVRIGGRSAVPYTAVAAGGVGSWFVAVVATGIPVQSVAPALALAAIVAVAERGWAVGRSRRSSRISTSRRTALAAFGALAGFVGVAVYRGTGITGVEPGSVGDVTDGATQAEVEDLLDIAGERSLDVPGLTGLVTPIESFYEVDVNNVNPNPSDGKWSLSITGAVERGVSVDFEELAGMTAAIEHRFVTLRCVGERLNGRKMDTAVWTGVPASVLLDRAGAAPGGDSADDGAPETCCVMVRAVDDYYQEFPLEALEDAFLAFGMNGRRLPRGHGYPVRLLVPGHWGEINVKWLTEIEVLEAEKTGYWEKRGWHGTGPVNTVAKLHAVEHLDRGTDGGGRSRMQVGGHAYAGTRGIERVEVSTDAGETWNDATLSEPLPGSDVWRQWRYEWDAEPGEHEVVVRAVDGEGDLQPEEFSQPYPSGATGWVSRTVDV